MVFPWFYFQTHESHILCQVCTPLNTLHLSTFPLNNWPVIPVSTLVDVKPATAPGDHVVALFLEGDHCSSIGAPCCFVLPSSSIPKPPQHPHAGSVSVVPSRGLPSIPSKSLKWEETEPDTKSFVPKLLPPSSPWTESQRCSSGWKAERTSVSIPTWDRNREDNQWDQGREDPFSCLFRFKMTVNSCRI